MNDDPYVRFLHTADVESWRACMAEAQQQFDERGDGSRRVEALAHALCISIYLQWLGRQSGDEAGEAEARRTYEGLRDMLERMPVDAPGISIAWGLVLAWSGFVRRAARLLEHGAGAAPEHRPLIVRGDIDTVATLREVFMLSPPCDFLPAASIYASSLVNIGAVHEARAFLAGGRFDEEEPLVLDVLASIRERLGEWELAYAHYSKSSWPVHRYRAAMVGAIAGGAAHGAELDLDAPTRELLGAVGGEVGQNEVTRSAAFLNACLWQPTRSWLVDLELGKLSFRRRRYAEADTHLERALAQAPAAARFVISRLRFVNVTWLTSRDVYSGLQRLPEAVSEGDNALALSEDDDDTAGIRTWMTDQTGDLSLIPATTESWVPYDRAEAYEALGDLASAIDCWFESLASAYYHRTVRSLIWQLQDAGFTETVFVLAELVLQESHDDFMAISECADTIGRLVPQGNDSSTPERMAELADRFRQRLMELSQLEFKNAIRAYQSVAEAGHPDLAEELLLAATRQAEGVSALLAVAVLRRRVYGGSAAHADEEGLRCLARALGEARDRLERLEIARELFHYGQIREGRRILAENRVLQGDEPLSHLEMNVALQCGPWLTSDERSGLIERAVRQLHGDHKACRLGRYSARYKERLVGTIEAFDPAEAARASARLPLLTDGAFDVAAIRSDDSTWGTLSTRVRDGASVEVEDEDALRSCLEGADLGASLGLRVKACASLRAILEGLLNSARTAVPDVPSNELPVRHDHRNDGARVIELCDLWRSRIVSTSDDEARDAAVKLRGFFVGEDALATRWAQRRRTAAVPILRAVVRVASALGYVLELPLQPPQASAHPVLTDIFEAIGSDLRMLAAEATEQIAVAQRELAASAEETVTGSPA